MLNEVLRGVLRGMFGGRYKAIVRGITAVYIYINQGYSTRNLYKFWKIDLVVWFCQPSSKIRATYQSILTLAPGMLTKPRGRLQRAEPPKAKPARGPSQNPLSLQFN